MRVSAACAAGLVLAACNARSVMRHRREPGALVVAQPADVLSLDPVRVVDTESIELGELIFEGLVGWKPGTTDIEPMLATSWQLSPDARTWTFHLRDHVLFQDGT